MSEFSKLEYIWLDGYEPTQNMRSKTMIRKNFKGNLDECPMWSFDGSSTKQADGGDSDCLLKPVALYPDPQRDNGFLVMCEVMNADGTPHVSNFRSKLKVLSDKCEDQDAWFGIEQEYTFMQNDYPFGWPKGGFPGAQGPFYCGVGSEKVYGRDIVEDHMDACIMAGILISGINAEVMPGQWEFQIGPVGAPNIGDEIWIARWLLYRIAEDYNISATLTPKPV